MTESRAVVTLAAGEHGRHIWSITEPAIRQYANRLGAQVEILERGPANYPLAGKFHLDSIIDGYDRTLFIDADCVPLKDAADIFDIVPTANIGLHDDGPFNQGVWYADLAKRLCDSQGWEYPGWDGTVWNSGVMVFSREHARIFKMLKLPNLKPYPKHHCSEQTLFQLAVERLQVPVTRLPTTWNCQWWFFRRMPDRSERPGLQIQHFAGAGQKTFNRTREELYSDLQAAVNLQLS
jgi:lipopolysaccharide biosynthesis glycosyltransferase